MSQTRSRTADAVFDHELGGDYNSIRQAVPHYDEFERSVAKHVRHVSAYFSYLTQVPVVEIGTGTGITTAQIYRADPRIFLRTIDHEPVMLKQAEKISED